MPWANAWGAVNAKGKFKYPHPPTAFYEMKASRHPPTRERGRLRAGRRWVCSAAGGAEEAPPSQPEGGPEHLGTN